MNYDVSHAAGIRDYPASADHCCAVSRLNLKFGRDGLLLLGTAVRDYRFQWEVSIPK
jgi:hypothetical protein